MRRKDREITDPARISEIIGACSVCRLGFCDDGEVYIVPMNFGCVQDGDATTFYFHSAAEGRKIDLVKKVDTVGFEMDCNYELYGEDTACTYSARFESVIGVGKISFVCDIAEKNAGLKAIMFQSTKKKDWDFEEKMLEAVCVFKVEVIKLSCKFHE